MRDYNHYTDDECKALLEWVDSLDVGELFKLKELYEQYLTTPEKAKQGEKKWQN